ncbi:hypothetical protein R3W88_025816 [Solanum pinnatisectum]|uniref:S-protein homolog n=1 Tax=Solanum pinnatisectum TaxID=50273 RepID=A0AAV9M556_9SOLN|nr:hypothetical protein R3W88_025816 [Solanum pinnatisectum]
MKKIFLFVFLFLFTLHKVTSFSQRTYHVYIASALPENPSVKLNFHCQSKDDDLGNHELLPGQNWSFKFHENFIRSTLFYCDFEWDGKQKTFNVFDDSIACIKQAKGDQTDTCYWLVKSDGFYLAYKVNPPSWALTKYYDW